MNGILRWMFFALIVRPLILVIIGLNVRHRERLPQQGPAIIAANHNSHLDTLVLMSLVPLRLLPQIRTVGAADYFMRNRLLAWFATAIIGIIPVNRMQPVFHPLADAFASLDEGRIVIMYPEGTRGEPEVMRTLKRGIGHIAQNYAAVPVIPVFMHGLGKAMPKGDPVLVPFFCDVYIGEPVHATDNVREFMVELGEQFAKLREESGQKPWV